MKIIKRILIIIAWLAGMKNVALAQSVCSYSCAVTMQDINANCGAGLLAESRFTAAGNDLNPFVLFDDLLAYLPKDKGEKLIIDYSFRACANVCSAAATLDPQKRPIIFYNPQFFQRLNGANDQVKWMIYGIFAHEIGHELLKHPTKDYTKLSAFQIRMYEKEADFFSGYLLSKIPGSTKELALLGLSSLNPVSYKPANNLEEAYANYPTLEHRKEAVRSGFLSASNDEMTITVFNTLDSLHKYAVNKDHSFPILFRFMEKELSLKNFKKAESLLSEFKKNNPNAPPDVLANLQGIVHAFQQKDNAAKKNFIKAVELDPNNTEYLQHKIQVKKEGSIKIKDVQKLKELKNKQSRIQ